MVSRDRLDASTLVDGNVDDHGAGFMLRTICSLTITGARPPAHQHRADHEIGIGDAALDRSAVGGQRHDPPFVDLVDPAQAVEVLVDEHDLGLHASGDPGRVPPDVSGAQHHDFGRSHAGRASHQHSAATVVPFEEVGALLRRQPAGHLAHRGQQRQRPVGELHRLVRQGCRAGGDQRLGDVGIGGQVEVGEQHEVLAQEPELVVHGFLDLDDQLLRPGVLRGRHDRRPGGDVVASAIEAPSPAPVSTNTSMPWRSSSRTPSGVIATRCSAILISVGTPTVRRAGFMEKTYWSGRTRRIVQQLAPASERSPAWPGNAVMER